MIEYKRTVEVTRFQAFPQVFSPCYSKCLVPSGIAGLGRIAFARLSTALPYRDFTTSHSRIPEFCTPQHCPLRTLPCELSQTTSSTNFFNRQPGGGAACSVLALAFMALMLSSTPEGPCLSHTPTLLRTTHSTMATSCKTNCAARCRPQRNRN